MATKVHFETNLLTSFPNQNLITDLQNKPKPHPWMQHLLPTPSTNNQVSTTTQICSHKDSQVMERHGASHNKEILRQTMLKQEEIFKAQVRELHRLYHVQRSLMTECRSKGSFDMSPRSSAISETSPPFQIQIDDKGATWNGLSKAWDISNANTIACDFLGKCMSIKQEEIKDQTQDFYRLQTSKASCRAFDLDLERPADEYIEQPYVMAQASHNTGSLTLAQNINVESSSSFDMDKDPDPDVQLTLGTCGWGKSKSESTPPQSRSSSKGFSISDPTRDHSHEVGLFPVSASLKHGANFGAFHGSHTSSQDGKGIEDCTLEWQSFDKNKEAHSVEAQSSEKAGHENLKKPSWLLQALNLNQT